MLFLLLIVVLFIALVAFYVVKQQGAASTKDDYWPFVQKKPLSAPEQVLYYRLIEALPGFVILPQVGLSRFLSVKKGENQMQWFNRINRMSVDFLVCNKAMQIAAAIELDDASHQRADRVKADAKKDAVLAAAGIKLVRWQVKAVPSADEITALFVPKPAAPPSLEQPQSAVQSS